MVLLVPVLKLDAVAIAPARDSSRPFSAPARRNLDIKGVSLSNSNSFRRRAAAADDDDACLTKTPVPPSTARTRPQTARYAMSPRERAALVRDSMSRAPFLRNRNQRDMEMSLKTMELEDAWSHIEKWKQTGTTSPIMRAFVEERIGGLKERVQILQTQPKYNRGLNAIRTSNDKSAWKCFQDPIIFRNRAAEGFQPYDERLDAAKKRKQDIQSKEEERVGYLIENNRRERAKQTRQLLLEHQQQQEARKYMVVTLTEMTFAIRCWQIVLDDRAKESARKRWLKAIVTIQRFVRSRILMSNTKARKKYVALGILRRTFLPSLCRWQAQYKNAAADKIVLFIRECKASVSIKHDIQKFLKKIMLVQRFLRGYSKISQARRTLLELQWDKIENERLRRVYKQRTVAIRQAKKSLSQALEKHSHGEFMHQQEKSRLVAKRSIEVARTNYVKGMLPPKLDAVEMILPEIKQQLITNKLKKMREKHKERLRKHKIEVLRWEENRKTQRHIFELMGMDEEKINKTSTRELAAKAVPKPVIPFFRVLLPKSKIVRMIEKGRVFTKKILEQQQTELNDF